MAKGTAKTEDKVMVLVEEELKKNPDATVDELYEKAVAANKSVSKLSKRQFHARYPLQVKRRKSSKTSKPQSRRTRKKKKKKEAAAAPSDAGREAVRTTLMSFASDMASAEARKDLVQFLAGIDKYVDKVMKAASK